jgi:ribonuclease HII
MFELDRQHPQYGFKQHMGYATEGHINAIKQFGVIECHRKKTAGKCLKKYLANKNHEIINNFII